MSKEVVKCCFNCAYYHFFDGKCDLRGKMPPTDLKLPCDNFHYKGGKMTTKVKRGNVYKIAFKCNRRTAKRHLYKSFQADTLDDAMLEFMDVLDKSEFKKGYTLELLTGNWKLITYQIIKEDK